MASITGTPADLSEDEITTRTFDEEHARLAAAREQHPWGLRTSSAITGIEYLPAHRS